MKLSLDTDVAIEVMRGRRPHYRVWLEQAQSDGATLHLSSLVFHELMSGAMASTRPERHMQRVAALASVMEVHPWTPEDAMEAARIRTDLDRAWGDIGAFVPLIAGQAINGDWTLVTGNLRGFFGIPRLKLACWEDPAGPLDRTALVRRAYTK